MEDINLQIRRQIMLAQPGTTTEFNLAGRIEMTEAHRVAWSFAQNRDIAIRLIDAPGVLKFERLEGAASFGAYPELDKLKVGESHLYKVPPAMHQRLRNAASLRYKRTGMAYSCNATPDGMLITRLASKDEMRGYRAAPQTKSRWGMERLATEPSILIHADSTEHHKIRLAASQKGRTTGWSIRCRLQQDGAMLIYRVDDGAPGPAPIIM